MKDKNLPYSLGTMQIDQIDLRVLAQTERYPTTLLSEFELAFIVGTKDGNEIAQACVELPPGSVALLHIYLAPDLRTRENITHVVQLYTEVVLPWLRDLGYLQLCVQCDYNDTKTMTLFKTFGFDPVAVWTGVMDT